MRRFVALFVTATAAALFWTQLASAAPVTKTLNFPLSGHSTTSIYDSGPQECCNIHVGDPFDVDLGDITAELTFNLDSTLSSPTHSALTFTDTNLRQGRTLDLTNTYSRDSGGTFDAKYTLALTADVYGFNVNPSVSESDTLSCAEPLESESCAHTKSIHLFSITVLDVGVGKIDVDLDVPITTDAALTSDGVTSNRTLSVAGAPILGPGDLTFTSDPDVKNESTLLSCSLPPNEPVNYAMDTATSHVNGSVTEHVGLSVSVVGKPIVGPNFTILGPFDIFSVALPPVTLSQIDMSAPGQSVDLGTLLPNNIPPTISSVTSGGTMVEGQDVTFTAGESSPCGTSSLHTVWKFSNPDSIEPMVAYGPTAHIVFPDNGQYEGTVTVTDPTGLSTTQDLTPFTITNANPKVDPVKDNHGVWGTVIKYHVDAFDVPQDQGSLAYHWDFGDGSSANGQDVEHVFAAAGSYNGTAWATDKDGGTSSAPFTTRIDKRKTTMTYIGDLDQRPNHFTTLAARLVDELGQPVVGASVKFTLGAQTATALTDSTGLASYPLTLTQKPGAYTLTASYLGDANYLASSSGPQTFGIPNGSGAVPMIALMGANQTWTSSLKRLVARTNHKAHRLTVHRLARRAK